MIGGFDQFHFFKGCTAEQTRAEVRRCFQAAGSAAVAISFALPTTSSMPSRN